MSYTYCRPHVKTITPAMRFVVRTNRGISMGGGVTYQEGEEFPANAVNEQWLRMLYEQLKIDLLPEVSGEASAPDRGKAEGAVSQPPRTASQPAAPRKVSADLEQLSRNDLVKLCEKFGVPTNGDKEQLRARLSALVG